MKYLKLTEQAIQDTLKSVEAQLRESKLTSTTTFKLNTDMSDEVKKQFEKAEVHITQDALDKMTGLIQECSDEIAWHGTVSRDAEKPNVFWIDDILVFPQTVTGATVDTDETEYTMWLYGEEVNEETFNRLRFHGHSHVNMGVTPSATDENHRSNFIQNVNDFYIFGIFNKKDDFNFTIFDVENNVVYEKDDITYYVPCQPIADWAKEQIKNKVTKKVTTYGYGYNSSLYGTKNNVVTKTSTSSSKKSSTDKTTDRFGRKWNPKTKTWDYDWEEDDDDFYDKYYGRYGCGYEY